MESGEFEKQEVALIQSLLSGADRFVNVGANFGYYVCLAQACGVPTTAVEPLPENREILDKNIRRNEFENGVSLLPFACGEKDGTAEIFGVGTGASLVEGWARNPRSLKHLVGVRRLDDLVPPSGVTGRTLFLVDVEGFELEVMKGASGLLALPDKPVWIIESGLQDHRPGSGRNESFLPLVQLMAEAGYSCYAADDLTKPLGADLLSGAGSEALYRSGTINFVFKPTQAPVSAGAVL